MASQILPKDDHTEIESSIETAARLLEDYPNGTAYRISSQHEKWNIMIGSAATLYVYVVKTDKGLRVQTIRTPDYLELPLYIRQI